MLNMVISKEEKKILLELICEEQIRLLKTHTQYNHEKYMKLENLKIKIKD